MDDSRQEYLKEEVVPSLWRDYTKTSEYKVSRRIYSINSTHYLLRTQEMRGLKRVIHRFIGSLRKHSVSRDDYINRSVAEWFKEWHQMHDLLFQTVLKKHGNFRKKDVRFGSPGDEDLYKIPKWQEVGREMQIYAANLSSDLKLVDRQNLDSVCTYLARVHYQFIRIHPFEDGNGRIARAITDQLAVSLGLPPIVVGFPRSNEDKKREYHMAIHDCIGDPSCSSLMVWIRGQVLHKIDTLA